MFEGQAGLERHCQCHTSWPGSYMFLSTADFDSCLTYMLRCLWSYHCQNQQSKTIKQLSWDTAWSGLEIIQKQYLLLRVLWPFPQLSHSAPAQKTCSGAAFYRRPTSLRYISSHFLRGFSDFHTLEYVRDIMGWKSRQCRPSVYDNFSIYTCYTFWILSGFSHEEDAWRV